MERGQSMTETDTGAFDILIVAQSGRLTYEAVLFAASLRHHAPDFAGKLYIAEPRPGPLWPKDTMIDDEAARDLLTALGVTFLPFDNRHFGASYPHGNKIEALAALPAGRPFVFFDTDTLITGPIDRVPFDFDRPSASMEREATWPEPPLYGPGYDGIWRALYKRFDIDIEPTLDLDEPFDHWQRSAMRDRYQEDLCWLASGADGLAVSRPRAVESNADKRCRASRARRPSRRIPRLYCGRTPIWRRPPSARTPGKNRPGPRRPCARLSR